MDIQRLKEILERPGSTSIVVGEGYGLDEMASALSLYLAFSAQGKQVNIISKKQPQVEVSNLVGIDQVKSKFESTSGDLVVSFPFRDDEIGKVSYTLENGLLNIIVKPKGEKLSFSEKDVIFTRSGDIPGILITVGVKRLSELQGFFNVESLKNTTIINVDKGQNNENFGEVVIISQGASSVSEQVASLLMSLAYPMDPDIAQNLFAGVIQATGNFQSPKTSSLAFEMAGVLLRNGARREAPQAAQTMAPQNARIFGTNRPTRPFVGGPAPRPTQQLDSRPRQNPQQPRFDQTRPAPRHQERNSTEFSREIKQDDQDQGEGAPPDWLAPKIYKGSTNVE